MPAQTPPNIWFAGFLCAAIVLAAAFEPYPPIFLGLCLIAAVCFAIKTIGDEKDS